MFRTHHNLSDQINRNIVRSEIEGGVFLKDLPGESTLEVATQNRRYTVVLLGDGQGADFRTPRVLPGARVGADQRIELGRIDAEDAVSGARDAYGVTGIRGYRGPIVDVAGSWIFGCARRP
jgi:hypothetical protein